MRMHGFLHSHVVPNLHKAHRIAHRIWRLRKRKKLLLLVLTLMYVSLMSQFYAFFWVYPNTFLGSINVSGMTRGEISLLAERLNTLSYRIRVQTREYVYTYPDLGIQLDKDAVKHAVFSRNAKVFPLNTIALMRALWEKKRIDMPLSVTQQFTDYVTGTVFDFSEIPNTFSFDPEKQSLLYINNDELYRIDEVYLLKLLAERAGNTKTPLYPKLIKITNDTTKLVQDANERMRELFEMPVSVQVRTGGTSESFVLGRDELDEIASIVLSDDQTTVIVGIDETALLRIFNTHVKKLSVLAQGNVVTATVKRDLQELLESRLAGHTVNTLRMGLDDGPNTDGTLADTYIEVDISQQKMYTFKAGRLFKSYRVSTGLEYPTPTGSFTILNKTGLGFSNIYNVWMPYWMGFKYSDELHAYFGIHELPYTLTEGQKIQRPRDFIGKPNTGGCVALDVGAAREVYQFAAIGTQVHIYQ